MKIRNLFWIFTLPAFARAPSDQILMPPPTERGTRVLRNKNITFTNDQPDPLDDIKMKYSVKGRSRPDRTGKPVASIIRGTVVTPFRISHDKRWIAVKIGKSGLRAWVPLASLPPLSSDFKLVKAKAAQSSSASSAAETDSEE